MRALATRLFGPIAVPAARLRLALDRLSNETELSPRPERVLATACWTFPIYSHTFVYEELSQINAAGFDLRFVYTEPEPGDPLPDHFRDLVTRSRRSALDPSRAAADVAWWWVHDPSRVESLLLLLQQASGQSRDDLLTNSHIAMAFSFARLARAYRPSYLHSYFFYEGTLFTLVAAHLLGIPRGVSCYSDHMLDDFPLKLVPLHLRTCDLVVATSHRIALELRSIHPAPECGNILVKPNAVDASRFPFCDRSEPTAGDPYRLVCVSRLEPKKGLLDLVDAVRRVLDAGIPIEVDLVGAPEHGSAESRDYATRLETRIRELDLAPVVRLQGRRGHDEVLRFLHRAHVFVAPFVELESGDKDGIPTAVLEAMSTGLTIIATDAGSLIEPVEHGKSGLIVSQRDPAALASSIGMVLGDRDLRRRLGVAAAELVRDRYDTSRCDALLHERIREVIVARQTNPGRDVGWLRSPLSRLAATARAGNWWLSKLPPLAVVAYAEFARGNVSPGRSLTAFGAAMVSLCFVAWYAHVVNDLTDREEDQRSGKPNRLAGVPALAGVGLAVVLGAIAVSLTGVTSGWRGPVLACVLADLLIFTVYSVRPIRLKYRGWWAVVADAAGAHLIPALAVIAAMRTVADVPPYPAASLVAVSLWSFASGVRNILAHQYADASADDAAGLQTIGNRWSRERLRAAFVRVILPAEAVGVLWFVALVAPWAPLVVPAFGLFLLAEWQKVRSGWRATLLAPPGEMDRYVPFSNNDLYELWLPIGLSVGLALRHPWYAVLPILQFVLFWPGIRARARDIRRAWGTTLSTAQNIPLR